MLDAQKIQEEREEEGGRAGRTMERMWGRKKWKKEKKMKKQEKLKEERRSEKICENRNVKRGPAAWGPLSRWQQIEPRVRQSIGATRIQSGNTHRSHGTEKQRCREFWAGAHRVPWVANFTHVEQSYYSASPHGARGGPAFHCLIDNNWKRLFLFWGRVGNTTTSVDDEADPVTEGSHNTIHGAKAKLSQTPKYWEMLCDFQPWSRQPWFPWILCYLSVKKQVYLFGLFQPRKYGWNEQEFLYASQAWHAFYESERNITVTWEKTTPGGFTSLRASRSKPQSLKIQASESFYGGATSLGINCNPLQLPVLQPRRQSGRLKGRCRATAGR